MHAPALQLAVLRIRPAPGRLRLANPRLPDVSGVDALLIGEQHDAKDAPAPAGAWVERAGRARHAGRGDAGDGRARLQHRGAAADASEAEVQAALRWSGRHRLALGALGAGRDGGRARRRAGARRQPAARATARAMKDETLDALLPGARAAGPAAGDPSGPLRHAAGDPDAPMTRVQIARDRAMAQTLAGAARPGKTVVLLAGAGHVRRSSACRCTCRNA